MRTTELLRASLFAACLALAACDGGSAPVPAQPAPPPAVLRAGDIEILASAVDTASLPERVTREYGIARGAQTWMLLVTVRRGDASAPAKVEAVARTLGGTRIDIPMRATKTAGDYLDHIGTFAIAPPDTLQFDVQVTPQGAPTSTLHFTREIAK